MAENQNAADQASTLNDERATRLAKRAALFEAGQNPYPEHSELEDYVADIEAKYAELADGEDTEDVVKIAGRVVAKRGQGKIMFIVVRDATAEIQLFCRINALGETLFAVATDAPLERLAANSSGFVGQDGARLVYFDEDGRLLGSRTTGYDRDAALGALEDMAGNDFGFDPWTDPDKADPGPLLSWEAWLKQPSRAENGGREQDLSLIHI